MVASNICVLNLDEEDLPRSSLSVVLVGTAFDNSEVNNDKLITSPGGDAVAAPPTLSS